MTTTIGTKEFLDWNVGEGKRFKDLKELLTELKELKMVFGPNCGFSGGPIDEEIEIIEGMV